jgi:lysophospholipase L1-like esterase
MSPRLLGGAALLLAAAPAAAQQRERTDAPPIEPYKIILVGDSTMAPHSGWASAFCAGHVKSSVACLNLGRGGRSTRSYRAEGSWDIALAEAKVPGYRARYVLIQFGHNDQSSKPERWTDRTTEFPANLRRFVGEVRAAGATPILVTPLTRRQFKAGKLDNTLAEWSGEVRRVAAELKVPLVDLNARSAEAVAKLGAAAATRLAQVPPTAEELRAAETGTTLEPKPAPASAPTPTGGSTGPRGTVTRKFDYTHVGPAGAELFARQVAQDLAAAVPELRSQLLP